MKFTQPFIFQYDTEKYPFRKNAEEIFQREDLEKFHELKAYPILEAAKTDQSTDWHKIFYSGFEKHMGDLYRKFLAEIVSPYFSIAKGELVYQKIPTFRVHMVGNLGVGEFHRDSDYNHSSYELNVWLPFTDTYGTNTVWIHTDGDDNPPVPIAVKYGQAMIFNGADFLHGNYINDTPDTRVSIDFRICEHCDFIPRNKATLNTKKIMDIGGYFEKM